MELYGDAGFAARDEAGVYDAWRTEYRYGYKPSRDTGGVDAVAGEHGGPGSGAARELGSGSEFITSGMGSIAG